MKSAYIITMHCPLNYGAILQTYALQTHIESLGLKVGVIDYRMCGRCKHLHNDGKKKGSPSPDEEPSDELMN